MNNRGGTLVEATNAKTKSLRLKQVKRDDMSSVSAYGSVLNAAAYAHGSHVDRSRAEILRELMALRNEIKQYFSAIRDDHGQIQAVQPPVALVNMTHVVLHVVLTPLLESYTKDVRDSVYTSSTTEVVDLMTRFTCIIKSECIDRKTILPLLKEVLASLKGYSTSINTYPIPENLRYTRASGWLSVIPHSRQVSTRYNTSPGTPRGSSASVQKTCAAASTRSCSLSANGRQRAHRPICFQKARVCSGELKNGDNSKRLPISKVFETQTNMTETTTIRNSAKQDLIALRNELKSAWHRVRCSEAQNEALVASITEHQIESISTQLKALCDETSNSILYVPIQLRRQDQDELLQKSIGALHQCLINVLNLKRCIHRLTDGNSTEEIALIQVDILTCMTSLLTKLKIIPYEPEVVYLSSIVWPPNAAYVDQLAVKLAELQAEIETYRGRQ